MKRPRLRCGECGSESVRLVTGEAIYPHRPDLADRNFWRCKCGAYCGTHPGTTRALGAPAGPETRLARAAAHAAFDPLWRARQRRSGLSKTKARERGYRWLAEKLGIRRKECHIGMMDLETARRVVEICAEVRQ
jgi:hypothetical protein